MTSTIAINFNSEPSKEYSKSGLENAHIGSRTKRAESRNMRRKS